MLSDSLSHHFVGVDVSQATLDVHIIPGNERLQVPNAEAGIERLCSLLAPLQPERIVFEATGKLEINAAAALYERGLKVAIVNPRQVRDYAKATGELAKTDRLDARILALFAANVPIALRPAQGRARPRNGGSFGAPAAARGDARR